MKAIRMTYARRQRGFSFLEVLVAMVILGIAVLAFAGLQVRALNTTGTAHVRAQAMSLGSEFAERMRVNDAAMATYRNAALYDGPDAPAGNPSTWANTCFRAAEVNTSGCSAVQMATYDINEFEFLVGQVLPAGGVSFAPCGAAGGPDCVTIAWGGTSPQDCVDNSTPNCVVLEVVVE